MITPLNQHLSQGNVRLHTRLSRAWTFLRNNRRTTWCLSTEHHQPDHRINNHSFHSPQHDQGFQASSWREKLVCSVHVHESVIRPVRVTLVIISCITDNSVESVTLPGLGNSTVTLSSKPGHRFTNRDVALSAAFLSNKSMNSINIQIKTSVFKCRTLLYFLLKGNSMCVRSSR